MNNSTLSLKGKIAIYKENKSRYRILSDKARMRMGANYWVDAVTYEPLYDNKYEVFIRPKNDFLSKFTIEEDTAATMKVKAVKPMPTGEYYFESNAKVPTVEDAEKVIENLTKPVEMNDPMFADAFVPKDDLFGDFI